MTELPVSPLSKASRLDVLDGLRGIAILLVLSTHLSAWLAIAPFHAGSITIDINPIIANGGYGVDLFFFLSGFCLFNPYVRAFFDGRPPPSLSYFVSRRAAKILPSYLLAIGVLTLPGFATYQSAQDAVVQILRHILFIHTWFPDSFASISGVFWSLGVEIQFYVLFPLLVGVVLRRPLLTFILALVFASISRFFLPFPFSGMPGYIGRQLPAEIDLFVSGMVAAYLFYAPSVRRYTDIRFRWAWSFLAGAGVVLFVVAVEHGYDYDMMHGPDHIMYRYAVPLLDAAFIAVTLGASFGFRVGRWFFANPLLTFLALISYNLYLYHLIVRDEFRTLGGGIVPVCIIVFFSIIVASIFTFYMERPLLRYAAKLYDRRKAESDCVHYHEPTAIV